MRVRRRSSGAKEQQPRGFQDHAKSVRERMHLKIRTGEKKRMAPHW
jgi:hypothetical protein